MLLLNKQLFVFRVKNMPLFCNKKEETSLHILVNHIIVNVPL